VDLIEHDERWDARKRAVDVRGKCDLLIAHDRTVHVGGKRAACIRELMIDAHAAFRER